MCSLYPSIRDKSAAHEEKVTEEDKVYAEKKSVI